MQKEKKILTAILTWSGIITLVIFGIIIYNKQLNYYDNAILRKKDKIINLKRQVANKPALEDAIQKINLLMEQSNIFLRASNKQAADALLLSQVKKIIEEGGGEIRSLDPMNNRRNKSNNSRINVDLSASQEDLINIIKTMSSSKPLLNITHAGINPLLEVNGRRRVETGKVRAQLQIEGFFDSGEQP